MRAELCIEAGQVSVWKRSGYLAVSIAALTVTLIALDVEFLLAAGVGIALEVGRRVYFWRRARPRPALVRANARSGELLIERDDREIRIERAKITDCWQRPDPETGAAEVLAVTPRALVKIRVPDVASAGALGRALGMDPASHVVSTTLTGPPTLPRQSLRETLRQKLRDAAIASGTIAAFLLVFVSLWRLYPALSGLVVLMPLPALLLLLHAIVTAARAWTPSRVFVGSDGLFVIAPGRREFIGYERVKEVKGGVLAVVVKLINGETVSLPLSLRNGFFLRKPHPLDEWVCDPDQVVARRRALTSQINEALTRFREAGSDANTETVARLLERDARPIPEWRAAVTQAHGDTYRERQLDTDQLVNVLENPRLPLGQRLGAALALAEHGAETAPARARKARVRAAIASSANPRVRIALERAAEGTLDDAAYEQALRAEAEVRRIKA